MLFKPVLIHPRPIFYFCAIFYRSLSPGANGHSTHHPLSHPLLVHLTPTATHLSPQVISDPRCEKSGVYWSWNGNAQQVNAATNVDGGLLRAPHPSKVSVLRLHPARCRWARSSSRRKKTAAWCGRCRAPVALVARCSRTHIQMTSSTTLRPRPCGTDR